LEAAGLVVEYPQTVSPSLEAVEQMHMYVTGADVDLCRHDDGGKLVKNLEHQRPDAGTAVVDAVGIGASRGAAAGRNKPSSAQRHGMWMLTVQSEDAALRQKVEDFQRAVSAAGIEEERDSRRVW